MIRVSSKVIKIRIAPDIELAQEIDIDVETVKVDIPMTVDFFSPTAVK